MKNCGLQIKTAAGFNPIKAGYKLYSDKSDLGILSSLRSKTYSHILWPKNKRLTDMVAYDNIDQIKYEIKDGDD